MIATGKTRGVKPHMQCPYCAFKSKKHIDGINRHIGQKHPGMKQMDREERDITWTPHPKQIQALERSEFEVLYGGARGGGKTDAGLAWLMYDIANPLFRGLVIRSNAKDLNDWIDRARRMYSGTRARIKGQPAEVHFPSGAIIRTGHLKDENAYEQYQGHEYHRILIEELTQIPQEKYYEQLISSCRSTVDGLFPQIFATTNPGGPGHQWVRDRWNIPEEPEVSKVYMSNDDRRVFIPARIDDNPTLVKKDPRYIDMISSISDVSLRRAWRHGYWGDPIIEGVIYRDEISAARAIGRIADVPHDPKHPVFTYWDIGVDNATAIGFFQKIGEAWRLIDSYHNSNKGMDFYNQIISARGYFYGAHYGPHDLRKREWSSGDSIVNTAASLGLHFIIVPKMGIEDGINAVKMKFPLLWIDKNKNAEFLNAISNYRRVFDDKLQMEKPKPLHDWTSDYADMLRYWAVSPDPVLPNEIQSNFKLYTSDYS